MGSEFSTDKRSIQPGHVLKGQYVGAFRSSKGKIKGLRLRVGQQEYPIKLPKYLRPVLVRELEPEAFIQVWAYEKEGQWRGINIMPLPPQEIAALNPEALSVPLPAAAPCLRVCRKGSCYRKGSGEVLQAMQQEIAANPELAGMRVETTGCLKACKRGPNAKLPSGEVVPVRPATAAQLLQEVSTAC